MKARVHELLLQRALLQPDQRERARNNPAGQSPLEYAVRQGWCDDEAVGRLVAEVHGVPYVDVTAFESSPELLSLVPMELMIRRQMLPLELRDGLLKVAMVDPANLHAQDDVRFLTGHALQVCTSGPVALMKAILREDELGGRESSAFSMGHTLHRTGGLGLREWRVGRAFAFHPGSATVLFLRDGEEHALGAVATARSQRLAPAAPRALFTDRELYGPREPIRMGVLCAASAGQSVQVELRSGGSWLPHVDVELDGNGLGWTSLPALPPGTYELTLGEATASFSIATYRLSPLRVEWHAERSDDEGLEGELRASVLGAPLEGTLRLGLLDEDWRPARRVHATRVETDASGRARVRLPLCTRGAASLEVRVEGRASLTATVRLPSAQLGANWPLTLCAWHEARLACSLPFEGSQPFRGLHVGSSPGGVSAPLRIVEVVRGQVLLELTRPVHRGQVVAAFPGGERFEAPLGDAAPGHRLEVPLRGPWTLLMVGVIEPTEEGPRCWEGRAAVLAPPPPLELEAPPTVRPGDGVALTLRGGPGASVWVSVRDARLTARRPCEVAAEALREALGDALRETEDGEPLTTLEELFPRQRRSHVYKDEVVYEEARLSDSDTALERKGRAPALSEEPPAVVLCQVVTLDGEGLARVDFQAPRLRGALEVDVFSALRGDWADLRASLTVHQPVHGELLLPRYVSAGERAAGTLHVAMDSGEAEVEVRYEGTPLPLHAEGRSGHRLRLSAPGAEVRFDAMAGRFEAEVRADGGDLCRVGGRVEHPGRTLRLERSVVALAPGKRLEVEGREARARVLVGLDVQARRMAQALGDYSHSCAEQTSAIALGCISELLMKTDRARAVACHLVGVVERLESMALPEGPFRAYPDAEVHEWLSKATATHLLELEDMQPRPELKSVWTLVLRARMMGQRAAKAHRLEVAPARPATARQALACLRRDPQRARELAERVLAGMGSWEGQPAVLGLGALVDEAARPVLASEVRAETAYGAAVLLRAGADFFPRAAPLVRTALGELDDQGRCYSTLDSVAALALLAAMPLAEVVTGACGVDGERLTLAEASRRAATRHVEALDSPLLVELERLREADLSTTLRGDIAGTVRLERDEPESEGPPRPGESLELVVRLDAGYHAGDLLQVFLPPALAWLHGGAQTRGFALDFEGRDVLRVPLVVTAATVDAAGRCVSQRCGVYLRNMYDERRGSAFDALTLVAPPAGAAWEGGPGVLEQRVAPPGQAPRA